VVQDTINAIEFIEVCFLKEGVTYSDPTWCDYGGEVKLFEVKLTDPNDDVAKAEIFAQSVDTSIIVDSTADELLFRWNTRYGTDFKVKEYHDYFTKRWSRLLYVYILMNSKKYKGCGFIVTNTNERGERKVLEYHYKKDDRLFATIKAYLSRPDNE
jgi:hypothetical protein